MQAFEYFVPTEIVFGAGSTEKLPELIEEAEKFIEYSGKEKKEYVMDKIGEYAEELGIKADLQFVSEKIEELVKLTKGVNMYEKKEKD